jgi:hypothetical protein
MLVVCSVFSHNNGNDYGCRWGNMARAVTQWRRLVVSHEATVALHLAMLIAL